MRPPHFRVRTLMAAVGVAALLLWGAMTARRSYVYYGLAKYYGGQESGWRETADEPDQPGGRKFRLECVDYFARLARKYRRAAWHPWAPVAPDPHAPGYDLWVEQQRRAKAVVPGSAGGIPDE